MFGILQNDMLRDQNDLKIHSLWNFYFWLYSFVKGFNKTWHKIQSISINKSELNKVKEYFMLKKTFFRTHLKNWKKICWYFIRIGGSFPEFSKKLQSFTAFCHKQNAAVINDMKQKIIQFHPYLMRNNFVFVPFAHFELEFNSKGTNQHILRLLSILMTQWVRHC